MVLRIMGILLVGVLALTPSISVFAEIDESQESEKLYMMSDAEIESDRKSTRLNSSHM